MTFPPELVETDTYNGVTLRLDRLDNDIDNNNNNSNNSQISPLLFNDPAAFQTCLESSLNEWKQQGRKGIWIYVPPTRAALVPIATQLGFAFHMVNGHGMLILSRWLPMDTTPSRLPRGPMYQVGVGCVVLKPNDASQMLVVQELTGPAAAAGLWKMPTGLADPAEDIHEAAIRELHEETGLRATCDGILCLRQSHASRAGTRAASDLFFVCRMRLLDPRQELVAQPEEIAAIQWMSIDDYCNQTLWQTSPLYTKLNNVCRRAATERNVFQPATLPVGFRIGGGGAAGAGANVTNTLYGLPQELGNGDNETTTTMSPSSL